MLLDKSTLEGMRRTLDRKLALFMAVNANSSKSMKELLYKSKDFTDEEFEFIFKQKRSEIIVVEKKPSYETV